MSGIGGLFFRARDSVALGHWYQEHLGDTLTPSSYAMTAQLRASGIVVDVDPKRYPNGRFARLHDPEGNPIDLWQPAGRETPH